MLQNVISALQVENIVATIAEHLERTRNLDSDDTMAFTTVVIEWLVLSINIARNTVVSSSFMRVRAFLTPSSREITLF